MATNQTGMLHRYPAGDRFDERDAEIVAHRLRLLNQVREPREGDFVEFADGATERVSHVYSARDGWTADEQGVQTSPGGSWYLGDGYVSFSGGLNPSVRMSTLTNTGQKRDGRVWIFHHDHWGAGRGVDTEIPFRVYRSTRTSTDRGRGMGQDRTRKGRDRDRIPGVTSGSRGWTIPGVTTRSLRPRYRNR